jgi:phospholipase C
VYRTPAHSIARAASAALIALGLAACSGSGSGGAAGGTSLGLLPKDISFLKHKSGSGYISHVVVLVQENRSLDNFFATFPGADGATQGKMKKSKGKGDKTVQLKKVPLVQECDFGHRWQGFIKDYDNGKMDGFGLEGGGKCGSKVGTLPYQYVDPNDIIPYWFIAQNYVLGDEMFQTQGSGSFTAHQDLIRGGTTIDLAQTTSLVDYPAYKPWGCDGLTHHDNDYTSVLVWSGSKLVDKYHGGPQACTDKFPGYPSYTYLTLRDLLDAQGVSWKYYSPPVSGSGGLWNAFDLIASVRYGPEWNTNVKRNPDAIFTDLDNGTLSDVSWLVPDNVNSDHPGSARDLGPEWVASVVNAIGQSQYWDSCAIVVVWDDWGGFYDHKPPPFFDNWGGLGFRVPMLIVSPYARMTSVSHPGYISHTQYEFGSIIKFIENVFNLGRLGTTDVRANTIGDSFDFSQPPRPFVSVPSSLDRKYFEHQKPSYEPVDSE